MARESGASADEGGSSYLDFFGNLARDASNAYAANRNASNKPASKAPAAAPAASGGWQQYIKPVGIGVAVLVGLLVVKKMFK